MKALSITRPWAELILRGKDVENRTWDTKFRGAFFLHAAQSWAKDAIPFAAMADPDALVGMPVFKDDHPTGIVGIAELDDVCSAEAAGDGWPCQCGPWAMAGQRHWKLTNVRRLPRPVPCRGSLGLWTPPADVLAAVEAQYADIEVTR
ncbi:hypothetical protein [Plantactinospora sp. WMMB782]|uniref:hypothetical protein n=1 Tax=Plantactinospora sp. WMMB782 TaxID=3404121 RepID=UPI003B93C3DF